MTSEPYYIENPEERAEIIEESVDGLITKRQMWAYFLVEANELTAGEAAKVMDIKRSTVYSLKSKAGKKIINAYKLQTILQDDPWWIKVKVDGEKDE